MVQSHRKFYFLHRTLTTTRRRKDWMSFMYPCFRRYILFFLCLHLSVSIGTFSLFSIEQHNILIVFHRAAERYTIILVLSRPPPQTYSKIKEVPQDDERQPSHHKGAFSMAVYFKKIIDSKRVVCLIFPPWFFLQGLCSCLLISKPLCASSFLHFSIYLR